jgi:Glutamate dehydrogenase/leucine dehydrogenase
VTGKPIALGGSLGRREATGRGVFVVASEAARRIGVDIEGARIAVQGFGNVGGSPPSVPGSGLEAGRGAGSHRHAVQVDRYRCGRAGGLRGEERRRGRFPGSRCSHERRILDVESDILIPAALENQITEKNAGKIKTKIVVEGANGPTTTARTTFCTTAASS